MSTDNRRTSRAPGTSSSVKKGTTVWWEEFGDVGSHLGTVYQKDEGGPGGTVHAGHLRQVVKLVPQVVL